MIILIYFDWTGSRKELKDWNERIIESCKNIGVKYMGLYGPHNKKWNYVSIFESESYDKFLEMGKKVIRSTSMPHHISEILSSVKL